MNFLVVDDNRLLNRFLTTYLRGKGHAASSLTDSSKVESWLDLNPCDGLILDIGMPRDVDPNVRRVDGIMLYDLEGLERSIQQKSEERLAASADAEKIVAAEAHAFRSQLKTQSVVPTIVALRQRLEEICRQELESFTDERGPFTREQDQSLHAITAQVIQKIASSLARELKEVPEKEEQERMTAAVTRLFHLASPKQALAGARSETEENERTETTAIAI